MISVFRSFCAIFISTFESAGVCLKIFWEILENNCLIESSSQLITAVNFPVNTTLLLGLFSVKSLKYSSINANIRQLESKL
jgi:hypothetical protein